MKSGLISREPVSTCHGDCGALTPEEAWKQLRPNLSILTPGGHIVSDLINRDTLVEDFRCIARAQANAGIFVAADAWEGAADRLANVPAVDAVKVVRCKDCKHWIIDDYWNGNPDQVRGCRFAGWMCGANGYCLYGERKTNVEVQDD